MPYNKSMIYGKVFKVKKGKLTAWKQWCRELSGDLRTEAEETLREERLRREVAGTFVIEGEHYVLGFVDVLDGDTPGASDKDKEINQRHEQMKQECLEPVDSLEILYDIQSQVEMGAGENK